MAVTFTRTLRSLHVDRPRRRVEWSLLLVLAAWVAWSCLTQVPVYEVTETARLEVARAAHPLAANVAGRVIRSQLQLGRQVAEGDVLVELDATDAELAVREKQARIAALQSRRLAIEREVAAEGETLVAQQQARTQSANESQAQITRAEAELKFAVADLERCTKLRDVNSVPQLELERAQTLAETSRAKLAEAHAAAQRGAQDRRALENECHTRIVRLEREAVELSGDIDIEQVAIRRLERDITERQVRAQVSGKIGEVTDVRVGSVVAAGAKLCAIVPAGPPRAVAQFPPVVVGRLKPGQSARLRLAGFPWTQYGTVPATVCDISTEPQDGLIRVELSLTPQPTSRIPLDHGLTGSVEIEVEQVSPAVLVLRTAGQFLRARRGGVTK